MKSDYYTFIYIAPIPSDANMYNIVKGRHYLIGLVYILNLYNLKHIELAEKLGIKKQNISMWLKRRQSIPNKYLPVLEELFSIENSYFERELTEIDQLEIQKEKLKRDLKPIIKKYEQQFSIGDRNDLIDVPVYDKEEINAIERDIEKAKLVSRFNLLWI